MTIDFRSDILSGYRPEVIEAMVRAAADAPGFEAGEDGNERALQEEVAALFGFQAGLFVPTGTMGNQIALRIWCRPGQSVLSDAGTHLATNEASSTAGINSVVVQALAGEKGHPAPGQIMHALGAKAPFGARQLAAVWLENTHNRAGGTIMPPDWLPLITDACHAHGTPIHIDGARIWNAAVASGQTLDTVGKGADSMSVNLNKAIGAPLGSILLGDRAFVAEAARVRRMMGGWWRPIGLLAAAARAAIAGFEARLAADHRRAHQLAAQINEALDGRGHAERPQTNIVMLQMADQSASERFLGDLNRRGILAHPYDSNRIRFVTHSRISDDDIDETTEAARQSLASVSREGS